MSNLPTMPRAAWILGALGAAAILVAAAILHQPTEPKGSMDRLDELLKERTPHPAGSPAGAAQAARVARLLADAIGATAVLDPGASSAPLPSSGPVVAIQRAEVQGVGGRVPVANVVGRIRGAAAGPATMLVAHHDSVSAGPGAGDDGSGVVSVIEAARAMHAEGTQRDVIILLTDAEEVGLLGAIAFCAEHEWFNDVGAVVNIDSRGARGPCHIYQLGFDERALVEIMRRSVPRPVSSSLANEIAERLPNGSDFMVFRRVGLPGFNLAFIGGVEHYHKPTDTPENLDPGTLGHAQETALALARALDRSPPIATGVMPSFEEWRSRFSIGDPTAMRELRTASIPRRPEPSAQSFAFFWQAWGISWDAEISPVLAGGSFLAVLLGLAVAWRRGLLPCGAWLGAMGRVLVAGAAALGGGVLVAWGLSLYGASAASKWTHGALPVVAWPWIAAVWSTVFITAIAAWQCVPRRGAWANAAASIVLLSAALAALSWLVPAVAATALPIVVLTAASVLLAAISPRAISGAAAGFALCVQLWALGAVLFPLVPSLVDAMGFGNLPLLLIPPMLTVLAFVALLPGAARAAIDGAALRAMEGAPSSAIGRAADGATRHADGATRHADGLAVAVSSEHPGAETVAVADAQAGATADERRWRPS